MTIPSFRLIKPDQLEINRVELNDKEWIQLYNRQPNMESITLRSLADQQIIYAVSKGKPESKTCPLNPGDNESIDTDVDSLWGRATEDNSTAIVLVKIHSYSDRRLKEVSDYQSTKTIETHLTETYRTASEKVIEKETQTIFDLLRQKIKNWRGN